MDLKIIEPIKNYLKEFKTVDEFNLWYSKNKDEVDKLTTHKLNKMYKIDGYRITKIKGILMLKKDTKTKSKEMDKVIKDEIRDEINEIRNEINEIRDAVNKIISFIQESSSSIDVSPPSVT